MDERLRDFGQHNTGLGGNDYRSTGTRTDAMTIRVLGVGPARRRRLSVAGMGIGIVLTTTVLTGVILGQQPRGVDGARVDQRYEVPRHRW